MLTKLSDYFCPCLHPRYTYNKYTHEHVVAKCGHCVACDKSRSDRYVSMINNMSANSLGVYLITLTYSPECMPMAHIEFSDMDSDGVVDTLMANVVSYKLQTVITKRKPSIEKETRKFTSAYFVKDSCLPLNASDRFFYAKGMPLSIKGGFAGNGNFGVLDKSHYQNFIKRLRNNLEYAYPSIAVKYFVTGEYGSKTLHPHWHFILFTSHSIRNTELSHFVRLSWKYGRYDVQRVQSNAASYVASYCAAASSIPRFLQTVSFRPFCKHSAFSAFTFTDKETKAVLEELYTDDNPFIVKAVASGLDLFPLPQSLRLFAYPKPCGFLQLSSYQIVSILQRFEKECYRQHTTNPKFKIKVYAESIRMDIGFHVNPNDINVTYKYLTLSEIKDAYRRFQDGSKCCQYRLFDSSDYSNLYASYRAFKLAQIVGCSSYEIAQHVIQFYRGSATKPLNFGLSLLRYQYTCLEQCDSIQDVKFLYSFFNSSSQEDAMLDAGFLDTNVDDALKRFVSVVENTGQQQIKHKDRNSYYQYSLYHSN